jgi:hypothetical protein
MVLFSKKNTGIVPTAFQHCVGFVPMKVKHPKQQ